jgi:MoaA/NifB/PqqE/SkfB family radical SAM enzyme
VIPASFFRYYLAVKYSVHIRKPKLLLRLAQTAFQIYGLKRPLLRYVDFAVDFPCNLKCAHCFNTSLIKHNKRRKLLEVSDYRRIARECREMGAVAFSFQGGEPFLFLDRLEEIIYAFDPPSALISISTNGTLGTRENLKRLYRWGVDILTISLDSGIADEHDKFRGMPGAYARSLETIDTALSIGLRVTLCATISHQTVHSEGFSRLMNYAKNKRCQLLLAFAAPAGRWQENSEILLNAEDLARIQDFCQRNPFVRTDMTGNYMYYGCGAMKEIMYLTPYGDVFSCPFIHIAFGNAAEESITQIRSRALRNPYFKEYWPTCLAATDETFRNKILYQLNYSKKLPVSACDLNWGEPHS